jgi:hypothetical protein
VKSSQQFAIEVRGNAWVIQKKRQSASAVVSVASEFQVNSELCELHMMTSATLIEALYDAVDTWLANYTAGKTNLTELTDKDDTAQRCFGLWLFM